MKIADEQSDAIELLGDIKEEMNRMRALISELEYLVYEKDERVMIKFFKGGEHDKKRS